MELVAQGHYWMRIFEGIRTGGLSGKGDVMGQDGIYNRGGDGWGQR
jgi:hypothetical protein